MATSWCMKTKNENDQINEVPVKELMNELITKCEGKA